MLEPKTNYGVQAPSKDTVVQKDFKYRAHQIKCHCCQTYMPSVHASRGSLHTSLPTHTGLSTRGGQEGEAFLLKWGIISLGYHSFCLLHVGPGQGSTRSEPGGFLSHVTYFSGALLPDLGILIPTLPQ